MTKFIRFQTFDVYRPSCRDSIFFTTGLDYIDTVHYTEHTEMTLDDVRRTLIDHDGYPPDIIIRKVK